MKLPMAVACVFVALPLTAYAADEVWPSSVHLKAAGGRYENWDRPLPCRNGHIIASVTVESPTPTDKWEGGAVVNIGRDGDLAQISIARSNRTFLDTLFGSSPALQARLTRRGGGARDVIGASPRNLPVSKPIRLDLSITDGQTISATVDGNNLGSLKLKFPIQRVVLMASGAVVAFDNLVVECNLIS